MIKLALPAGDLRSPLASLLASSGLRVEGYGEGSRAYRLPLQGRENVVVRVFREKDIPIQIALGNYDLGVCNLAWLTEMQVRFPGQPVVALRDMGIGRCAIFAAAGAAGDSLAHAGSMGVVRLASEYPNLAETFAMAARLPAYRVQAVWGAAEAYPPEDADLAIVAAPDEAALRAHGLNPLFLLMEGSAWLIANADSIAGKDLSPVLGPLMYGASA
ncbi:MAG: ATP phosphoribosyltransferase, partial [Chloroflexi bacterium]|nr:ATP phosphoribosyltransferase [Chloroflexota bacterium]